MRPLLVLATLAALAACTTQPSAVAPSAPSPASTTAATAVPATDVAGAADTTEFRAPAGYNVKTRGGTKVYCRTQTQVGTRFASEYCYTQADLERMEANKRSVQQEIDKGRRVCAGAACAGG